MTSDDRIESYLAGRASQVDLPLADLDRITARARTRRHRRRATRGGVAAALLLGGVALVAGRSDDTQPVANLAEATVVPSELEWNVVPTREGLGRGEPVVTDDGTVYALSTAANPDPGETAPAPQILYRSSDGGEWEPVGLPDGLFASSLAAGDGSLYALGTTAAGGRTGPVDLARSTDGGGAWTSIEVPFDPAAEAPDFPGTVVVRGAEITVDGERTVVTIQVAGVVDVEGLLGPDDDPHEWYATGTGLERTIFCEPAADGGSGDPAPPDDGADPSTTLPPEAEGVTTGPGASGLPPSAGGRDEGCDPTDQPADHRGWTELGLDPALVAPLVAGYTVVLAGPTGGELVRTDDLPATAYGAAEQRSLVAADDGFWFVGYPVADGEVDSRTLTGWHSTDGTDWTSVDLPGAEQLVSVGVVAGHAMALTWGPGAPQLHGLGGGGSVADIAELLGLPAGSITMSGRGFGPMGVALVVQAEGESPRVVTSSDGVSYSVEEIPLDEMAGPGERASVNGVTVTADAIKVRVNVRASEDVGGGAPLAQQLYVGTPR